MEAGARARPAGGALLLPAISGVVLLVSMFALSWFGAGEAVEQGYQDAREIEELFGMPEVMVPDVSEDAWEAFGIVARIVLVAAGLCGLLLTLATVSGNPPVSRFAAAAVTTAAGTIATAIVLYHLVNPPGDMSRDIGVFVGLVAAGGVAVGGWIALEDEELRRPSSRRVRERSARRTRRRSSSG